MKPIAIIALWLCLAAGNLAVPIDSKSVDPSPMSYQDSLGQYSFGYSAPKSARSEYKALDGITHGKYSYIDDSGLVQTAEYEAGEAMGFRIKATNLPEAPRPIPETPEVLAARERHLQLLEEANRREQNSPSPGEVSAGDGKNIDPTLIEKMKNTPLPIFNTRITSLPDNDAGISRSTLLHSRNAPESKFNPRNVPLPSGVNDNPAIQSPEVKAAAPIPEGNRVSESVPEFKNSVPGEANAKSAIEPNVKNAALQIPDFRTAAGSQFNFKTVNGPGIGPITVAASPFEVNRAAEPVNRPESVAAVNRATQTVPDFRDSGLHHPNFDTAGFPPSFEFRNFNLAQSVAEVNREVQSGPNVERNISPDINRSEINRATQTVSEVRNAGILESDLNKASLSEINRGAQSVPGFKNSASQFSAIAAESSPANSDIRNLNKAAFDPRVLTQSGPEVNGAASSMSGTQLHNLNRGDGLVPEIRRTAQRVPQFVSDTGSEINRVAQSDFRNAHLPLHHPNFNSGEFPVNFDFNLRVSSPFLPEINKAVSRIPGASLPDVNKAHGSIDEINRAAQTISQFRRGPAAPEIHRLTRPIPDFTNAQLSLHHPDFNSGGFPPNFDFRSLNTAPFDPRVTAQSISGINRASSPSPNAPLPVVNRAHGPISEINRAAQEVSQLRRDPALEVNRAPQLVSDFRNSPLPQHHLNYNYQGLPTSFDFRNFNAAPFDPRVTAQSTPAINRAASLTPNIPLPDLNRAYRPVPEINKPTQGISQFTSGAALENSRVHIPTSGINRGVQSVPNFRNTPFQFTGFNPAASADFQFRNIDVASLDRKSVGQSAHEVNRVTNSEIEANKATVGALDLSKSAGPTASINGEVGTVPNFAYNHVQFSDANNAAAFEFRSINIPGVDSRTQSASEAVEVNKVASSVSDVNKPSPIPAVNRAVQSGPEINGHPPTIPNFAIDGGFQPNFNVDRGFQGVPNLKDANVDNSNFKEILQLDSKNPGIPQESFNKVTSAPQGNNPEAKTPDPIPELHGSKQLVLEVTGGSLPTPDLKNAAAPEINKEVGPIPNFKSTPDLKSTGFLDFHGGSFLEEGVKFSAISDLKNSALPLSGLQNAPITSPDLKNAPTPIEGSNLARSSLLLKSTPAPAGPVGSGEQGKYESVTYTPEIVAAREAHFRAFEKVKKFVNEVEQHPEVLLERLLLGKEGHASQAGVPSAVETKRDISSQETSAAAAAGAILRTNEELNNAPQPLPSNAEVSAKRIDSPAQAPVFAHESRKIESNGVQKLQSNDVPKKAVNAIPKLASEINLDCGTNLKVNGITKAVPKAERLLILQPLEFARFSNPNNPSSPQQFAKKNWALQYMSF